MSWAFSWARAVAETARASRASWLPGLTAAIILLLAPAVQAQPPPPDRAETARLVWTTLIAVDHANRTGNYSVLRDLGAPGFRQANDAARLAAIFAKLRDPDIGLGRAVLYAPEYTQPPSIQESGMFRVSGVIPMRPEGVLFDMLFQHVDGEWRLFGIGIAPEEPREIDSSDGTPKPKP